MKKFGLWNDRVVQKKIIDFLRQNKVIAGTSDTVIGLLTSLSAHGKKALDKIKGRTDKPYIVLITDKKRGGLFSPIFENSQFQSLFDACWPGPLTVIVPAHEHLSSFLKSSSGTIALRVPRHDGLQAILPFFKGLFSTSANLSGQSSVHSINDLDPLIIKKVSFIVDDENNRFSEASTILDLTSKVPQVIREGGYSKSYLQQFIACN